MSEKVNYLRELKKKIKSLAQQAQEIIKQRASAEVWERAKNTCLSQLFQVLDNEHEFDNCSCTLEEIIDLILLEEEEAEEKLEEEKELLKEIEEEQSERT